MPALPTRTPPPTSPPAASAATIDEDGWLNTGDIARFYADGNLFLLDRLKELIKVKGFEVAPAELEAIHQVPFTDAIPTSVSGKTLRRLLIAGEHPGGHRLAGLGQRQPERAAVGRV